MHIVQSGTMKYLVLLLFAALSAALDFTTQLSSGPIELSQAGELCAIACKHHYKECNDNVACIKKVCRHTACKKGCTWCRGLQTSEESTEKRDRKCMSCDWKTCHHDHSEPLPRSCPSNCAKTIGICNTDADCMNVVCSTEDCHFCEACHVHDLKREVHEAILGGRDACPKDCHSFVNRCADDACTEGICKSVVSTAASVEPARSVQLM
ncbi:hypothetical protein P280DRAFT_306580 [Massarina eburnea CBS 473.64]|uniref:Extracellular membrane protein CFEM domain-containing protein n=1 Tax=Massarina eburnea CBS 473.64 TaxID=1395130 RepID=A0A6A6S0A3_9PLEO|nr:hypothetical protein P280DRAFT_306580 [Massarina eburnea CBS 473.64]